MTEQPAVVVTMTQEIEKICQDGIRLIDEKLMPAARYVLCANLRVRICVKSTASEAKAVQPF